MLVAEITKIAYRISSVIYLLEVVTQKEIQSILYMKDLKRSADLREL